MKKITAVILTVMLLISLVPAQAAYGTLYMVSGCVRAPMYAGYSGNTAVLRYVDAGEIVYCFAVLDQYICVIYGNHVGYIDEQFLTAVDDTKYSYFLPNGEDYAATGGNQYVDYHGTQYFSYAPIEAAANQKLATRSGPGTDYTGTLTYPQTTEISAYYITPGSGVDWICIGFRYKGEDYLLYTGEKRVDANGTVPENREETGFEAYITQDLTPYYGPGYNYAYAEHTVPAGSVVTGIYRAQDGWLMFDYQVPGGRLQRAWAPAYCWK